MNFTIWCPLTFSRMAVAYRRTAGLTGPAGWRASRGACRAVRCRPALASLPDGTTMSGRSYLTTRRASGTLACTADEFVHPAGLHRLHCAMCLLATAMMLRRRRTQAEAPGLAGMTWLVSLNHRKRWIAAWGQRVHPLAHPLRRESAASYFEEAQLFKTRARV